MFLFTLTMNKENINIVYVPISELRKADYNPRKWSKNQMEQLKQSIVSFGVVDPLLVNGAENRRNIVLGGHFRLEAMKDLKHSEAPVVYLNIPDIEKEKELNIRLNKNQGEFDFDLLKEFDMTFLDTIGFSNEELETIYLHELDTESDGFNVEKELEKIKRPKSMVGDMYKLGAHRLVVGDASDIEVVKSLVGDDKVALSYLDPPYNISLSYNSGIGGTKEYGGTTKDNKTDEQYEEFLCKVLENAIAVSDKDAHYFMYCDHSYVPLVANLYKKLEIDFKRTCIWLKGIANQTPQIAFSKVYEPCVYGTIGDPYISKNYRNFDEILNKEVGTGNEMIEDVTDMFDIWLEKRLPGHLYTHPTEKPITLHDKPFKRCSKPGDIILSLFGGSGGDLIAADQLKRICYMTEADPVFADLILLRYEVYSGITPIKVN